MNVLVAAAAQQQLQNDNNVSADHLQTVEQVISKKHVLKSRKSYDTAIKHLARWLHEKFPGCVTQNTNETESTLIYHFLVMLFELIEQVFSEEMKET
jgi:hypothetical protein